MTTPVGSDAPKTVKEASGSIFEHLKGAGFDLVSIGKGIATFVGTEPTKLTGLKADTEKVAEDAVAEVTLVESGNVAGAVAALPAVEADVVVVVANVRDILSDVKAAEAPKS